MNKPKISDFGFYCGVCGMFVFVGYDSRDKKDLPGRNAVCLKCGENYQDIKKEEG